MKVLKFSTYAIILSIILNTHLHAEKVGNFAFYGSPEKINDSTIYLPEDIVAMSEYVPISNPLDIIAEGNPASVFIVIDHSASNFSDMPHWASDRYGNRFLVIHKLLDTLNKLSPNIEVGTAVFADNLAYKLNDDTIFKQGPNCHNGYIPLLRLNKKYESSSIGAKTGYEILQHYLDTSMSSNGGVPYVNLEYNHGCGSGTNIDKGFDAAKDAFQSAENPKHLQFVIFLSDGEGGGNYVDGKDVPTTFTIYLKGIGAPEPVQLRTMTRNIQTNGYSATNPKSAMWVMESDFTNLLKLMMDNVVTHIINKINSFTPETLTVNGQSSITPWDSTAFGFQRMFPLTGKKTPFDFEINYSVSLDSVDGNDTIHLNLFDTTHEVSFDAERDNNTPMTDSVTLKYWGRNLDYYHSGTKLGAGDIVTEAMKNLELRFEEYSVDTLIEYDSVEVSITTANGKDSEIFLLTRNGTYHTVTIPRKLENSTPNDGVIQHEKVDILTATFRNPHLPLDTLVTSIPYGIVIHYKGEQATYFDNNADGYPDSMYVKLDNTKELDINAQDLAKAFTYPSFRKIKNIKGTALKDGLGISFDGRKGPLLTSVTSEDRLVISKELFLPSGALVKKCDLKIADKMAPVIKKATLLDSMLIGSQDILTVTFSENIEKITFDKPFDFFKTSKSKEYESTLKIQKENNDEVQFYVMDISNSYLIEQGDSIRIDASLANNILDPLSNNQSNMKNARKEITVTEIKNHISINEILYFDTKADGTVDSIFIALKGKGFEPFAKDIVKGLDFPSKRKITIEKVKANSNGIYLLVKSKLTQTDIDSEDKISIKKDIKLDGVFLKKGDITPKDRMAPVIVTAHLIDSLEVKATDLLLITLSEEADKDISSKPFYFYYNKDRYIVSLKQSNHHKKEYTFTISSPKNKIQEGDSIHINFEEKYSVADKKGRFQLNRKNIKRPITVTQIPVVYELILKTSVLQDRKGMVILLEPEDHDKITPKDSLMGTFSLFDPLGNPIMQGKELTFKKGFKVIKDGKKVEIPIALFYNWDGKKELNKKDVGGSSYYLQVKCSFIFNNEIIREGVYQTTIGVMRN